MDGSALFPSLSDVDGVVTFSISIIRVFDQHSSNIPRFHLELEVQQPDLEKHERRVTTEPHEETGQMGGIVLYGRKQK